MIVLKKLKKLSTSTVLVMVLPGWPFLGFYFFLIFFLVTSLPSFHSISVPSHFSITFWRVITNRFVRDAFLK